MKLRLYDHDKCREPMNKAGSGYKVQVGFSKADIDSVSIMSGWHCALA